ncbi:ketoacyl-synt-domain-containing protein [Xylariaceae sp. FL1272]|nr:ketoacyl-synt-domain-containing protein [Xylariaceae sp. FL1272]
MSKGIANTDRVPASRFNIDAYLHPDNERPGGFNVPGGYFLEGDPYSFDPSMFKISPIEASWMDPQQRMLLEVTYEAFENSGTPLHAISGRKTGCFIGCFTQDAVLTAAMDPDYVHAYTAMGIDPGILSNRLSFAFDLKGPSLTVNTACSSTMYALDLACKSIYAGECEGAVVGGSNLILAVNQHMNTASMGVLSPTNQCHTFDASADGYGRAEAVGALYLRPLGSALRDGDPVRAIIRATATGSSGRGIDGMTMPSAEGQVDVIQEAYRLASLTPDDTFYVECHGTGTPVGDPIEVKALCQAIGASRAPSNPILIGSVKPNVGHSEAASSITTLMKTVMAVENGIVPATAGLVHLNPSIPWKQSNVEVVANPIRFPSAGRVKRIGVNAFGYGGTNAHAILESCGSFVADYCGHKPPLMEGANRACVASGGIDEHRANLLVFSAHNDAALKNNIELHAKYELEHDLIDLSYTLAVRRTHFSHRSFAIAHRQTIATDIRSAYENRRVQMTEPPRVAYILTGQGAQWAQMGASLVRNFPSALETIRRLDEHLRTLQAPPPWELETLILDPENGNYIDDAQFSQPMCTALQIAIVDLLGSWGLKPQATLGHSSGEIAAAYGSGLISAQWAIAVSYYRGNAVSSGATDGAMLAVGLSSAEARKYIQSEFLGEQIQVACQNAPASTTLSGAREAIERLKEALDARKIFARLLNTGGKAYHCYKMQEAAVSYRAYLDSEIGHDTNTPSTCPMFSTTKRMKLDGDSMIPNTYWIDNLMSPVLFDEGVATMLSSTSTINTLVEIGPHSALSGPLRQICQAASKTQIAYFPTLKRNSPDYDELLKLAGHLWSAGATVNLDVVTSIETTTEHGKIERRSGSLLVDLPPYHYSYTKSYRSDSRISREIRDTSVPRHDLLGRRLPGASTLEPVWRNLLRVKDLPWLSQHRIGGEVMLPATAHCSLAIEAITQVNSQLPRPLSIESYTLRDVVISNPIVIDDKTDAGSDIVFHLRALGVNTPKSEISGDIGRWYAFTTMFRDAGTWEEASRGRIALNIRGKASNNTAAEVPVTPLKSHHGEWLERGRALGIDLGPVFHHIGAIYTDGQSCVARGDMTIAETCGLMISESRYVLHPAVLDACLQITNVSTFKGHLDELQCGRIPAEFGELTLFRPSPHQLRDTCQLQSWTVQRSTRSNTSHSQLCASDGSLIVDISDYKTVEYLAGLPGHSQGHLQRDLYLQSEWKIDIDYLSLTDHSDLLAENSVVTLVDLALHKDPTMKILCLERSLVSSIVALSPSTALSIPQTPQSTEALDNADREAQAFPIQEVSAILLAAKASAEAYDLVIGPDMGAVDCQFLREMYESLSPNGRLVLRATCGSSETWLSGLHDAQFPTVEAIPSSRHILVTALKTRSKALGGIRNDSIRGSFVLVHRKSPTTFASLVHEEFSNRGCQIRSQSLGSSNRLLREERVILLADLEEPLLAELEDGELAALKQLVESTTSIVWVTCGGLLNGDKPEFGMVDGLTRALRNELGSLDIVTIDFDPETTPETCVLGLLIDVLERQEAALVPRETEYRIYNGVIHVPRIISARELSRRFLGDSGESEIVRQDQNPQVQGCITKGNLNFKVTHDDVGTGLSAEEAVVHVAAIGLTLFDRSDNVGFLNHQISGVVVQTGTGVDSIKPKERVFGFALGHLDTFQLTSSNLLHPIPPGLSMIEAATMASPYVTALYGLENLASIKAGDCVVLVDAMGDVLQAALQICRLHKTRTMVVTSSGTTKDLLVGDSTEKDWQTIIYTEDGPLSTDLHHACAGKGIDVIFCSTAASDGIVQELTRFLAQFGRLITFSQGVSHKGTELSRFKAGTTYSFFDIDSILCSRPYITQGLLERLVCLYTDRKITQWGSVVVREPATYIATLRDIPKTMDSKRYVISYETTATFQVVPSPKPLQLRPSVTYLLIGGLGGIGRKLALWMAERGARRLAFISRSGTDQPAARDLVQALRERGLTISVIRADVMCRMDLAKGLSQLDAAYPIGGVVNAAATISDVMFQNMTFDKWYPVIQSKYRGNRNLHELLKEHELDFFVMTSSISGFMGLTGQSNYAAANTYLDSLARHRRRRGLPAVSLVLTAIYGFGYIHEHSLEKSVQSKGAYGVGEREMLDAFEIAMMPLERLPPALDHFAVGLQPRRLGHAVSKSGAHIGFKDDLRLSWLAKTIDMEMMESNSHAQLVTNTSSESPMVIIQQADSMDNAVIYAVTTISRRLAGLLLIEEDAINTTHRSIASYGLDSMIGAEFRNWIFRIFKIEMPFHRLLGTNFTISELAISLCKQIRADTKE